MRLQRTLLGLALVLLSGCKIEITVPEGGHVESKSGAYVCLSGETCIVDVVDVFFDEVFQAKPAEDYKFVVWRQKNAYLCGGRKKPCPLTTTLFPGTPFMPFLESDAVLYLEPVFGQPDTWVTKARADIRFRRNGSCVVDGTIYVWTGSTPRLQEYDPALDTWVTNVDYRSRVSPPGVSTGSTGSAVNGKCYRIGGVATTLAGSGVYSTVEENDPKTQTLRDRASLPQGRADHDSAVVNGKIYVVGGTDNTAGYFGGEEGIAVSALYIYDPLINRWSVGADIPTPRTLLGVAALDGFIYAVGGGIAGADGRTVPSGVVERYDPTEDSWTAVASMPTKRWGLSVSAVDGALYAIGGRLAQTGASSGEGIIGTVERYDPKSDRWSARARISPPRWLHNSEVIDGQVYVVGGEAYLRGKQQLIFENLYTKQYTP